MAPLTCPACGGHLDLVTDGKVTHPAEWQRGHYVLPHTCPEKFVACSRCEYAETVATLLSGSAPKRPS